MHILLVGINAKYIHTNPAIRSLKAYAKAYADRTVLAEYTVNQSVEWILADIVRQQPDAVAFSCYIWNWTYVRHLLKDLPKVLPAAAIWLGGPEVSYDAAEVLAAFPQVTGVMVGEGEATFLDLCRHYAEGEPALKEIPGLCLPQPLGLTAPRMPLDADSLPFLYGDADDFEHRIPYYESSRGCPYRCSYCLSSLDHGVRLRSLEKVYGELDFFLEKRVPQVKFIDRTFNCDHTHCQSIWRYLAAHDNGVTNFHFEITADLLNEEELVLLNSLRPGLIQLEIGVQTTHAETVAAINRRMNLQRLYEVVRRLRAPRNMHIHLDLIAGLPEEDLATFRHSFNDVYALQPDDLQLGFLKVLKGSPMMAQAESHGLRYSSEPPYEVLCTRWLSYTDLQELKRVENVLEIYYNSAQYEHLLPLLVAETVTAEAPEGDAYAFYLELADAWQARHYDLLQMSREQKYGFILDFAAARHPERAALYRELLTFDCYLRENCKRRPDFAADLSPWKQELRALAPRREEHIEPFFYPVWETNLKDLPDQAAEPCFIRFDYAERSPLDHNAAWSFAENKA